MNRIKSNFDKKLVFKLVIGSVTSVLGGFFFKEAYTVNFQRAGMAEQIIPIVSVFFWTLVGVLIGFVIGFFIFSFFIDLLAISVNKMKLHLQGLFYTKSFVIDSSAILDGRIAELIKVGLFAPRVYMSSVTLDELNRLEKVSKIYTKRVEKGRKALDKISKQMGKRFRTITFVDTPKSIRENVLFLAKSTRSSIITLDSILTEEARNQRITVININELALIFRVQMTSGEIFPLKLIRAGKERNQAVGYLDDGMMVIVENAIRSLHKTVEVECVSVLQSTSGKIVFGKFIREIES